MGSHGGFRHTDREPRQRKEAQIDKERFEDENKEGGSEHTSIMTCNAGDDTVSVIVFRMIAVWILSLNCRVANHQLIMP